MFRLDREVALTNEIILKIIKKHKGEDLPRLLKLGKYYLAKNVEILNRRTKDASKPNNKIANPYASYITDTLTGYFLGKPITYNSEEQILEELNSIFEYADEADENIELAKSASIYGVAYEQVYCDEDGHIRLAHLPTEECVPIFDTTIEKNLIYFLRYFEDYDIIKDEKFFIVEVIDENSVRQFKADDTLNSLKPLDEYEHHFNMVPIAIFENNEELTGDFEKVITLIDAYDKMESDTLNDQEYFTDAYLALYGYTADSEDVKQMKEDRVLCMDEGTKAEWLIKSGNDTISENIKNRLDNDIHKFAKCPNMSDENFASNASGIAIKFKTLGTENIVSIKERKFKKGLQQRLELISMISHILGNDFDYTSIDIIFTRNIPTNEIELAQMVSTLSDVVSDETLLAQLPFIDDVNSEMEKIRKQKDTEKQENPFLQTLYQTRAMTEKTEDNE